MNTNQDDCEYEENDREAEIDISKVYHFPNEIVIKKYNGVYLAIYTEGILWLVLEDADQLKAFQLLREGNSIERTLRRVDEESVISVITQLEAKGFEHPIINENVDRNIYIYLTNNCNQRCRHCYMFAGELDFKELSNDEWISVLDDLKKNGGEGVTFTGGEVTVYKGFDKIIRHAHDIGLKVTVLSNGILWDKGRIREIGNCIDEIQISIDGYDKESYYQVRQYDGFDKAIQCVKDFCEAGTKVSIAVTPLYDRLSEFTEKFEPLARKLMDSYPQVFIKFNLELIPGREIKISKEENKDYKRKLRALVERLYPNFYTETFVLNYENHVLRRNCGFGGVSIAADGRVFWCNRIHELDSKINILDTNFSELFEESDRIMKDTSVDNTTCCKKCAVRYICGGGCRLKYEGIKLVGQHEGEWEYECEGKDIIYDKMIKSNEFFFE